MSSERRITVAALTYRFAAKRAGDYYMFDYDPSHDELKKDKESFVPEVR